MPIYRIGHKDKALNPQNLPNPVPASSNAEKWLSLTEASLHTPYSAEYLSLLARKGKLTAKKIDGVWYTTKPILEDYMQRQMLREQVQSGSSLPNPGSQPAAEPKPSAASPSMTPENAVSVHDEIAAKLKTIRSYHDDHKEYETHQAMLAAKSQTLNSAEPNLVDASHLGSTVAAIENALERVIEKKFSPRSPLKRMSFGTAGSLSKSLLALSVASVVFFTVMPVPFVFSFFEKSLDKVSEALNDARTVMGFRPGTHANELLLLDKNGDISIMGHIESHVSDGSAPFVVDSVTMVKNLNAEYVGDLKASDFTLAYVTKNGAVTTEDVKLSGKVEVGKSLVVSGLSALGEVKVLGDAEFKKILRVLGPAFFEGVVTAQSDLVTKGNFSVSKNANVRGSITAGAAVIGKSGSFEEASVSGTMSAALGKILEIISDEISVDALTAETSTTTSAVITTLRAATSTLAELTFTDASGVNSTTTNATTTNFFAEVLNAGTFAVSGAASFSDLIFTNATGTSATTTSFFSTYGTITNLVSATQSIENLVFTNATGTNATTTSLFSNVGAFGRVDITQGANGNTILSAKRATDTAPSGDFISYLNAAGDTTLFRVDNSGNIYAGGIANSGALTITSASTPQLRVQYDASSESTVSVSSTGATTYGYNGMAPQALWVPSSNSTESFVFRNASAGNVFRIDTTNNLVSFTNSTSTNATTTNATSTNIFATTASSTNLYSTSANVGTATVGSLTATTLAATNSTIVNSTTTNATTTQLAVSSLTSGSIPFATTGGRIADNNSQLYWDNNQTFLGLGINTPSQKLHVSGGVALFDSASTGVGAGVNSGLRIVAPISTSHFNWMIGAQQNVSGGFEITPSDAVNSTSFSTPALVVKSDGKVGIGTTAPGTALDVVGTVKTRGGRYSIYSSGNAVLGHILTATDLGATTPSGSDIFVHSENGFGVSTGGSATPRVFVTSTGNMGIGLTNPGTALAVNGAIRGGSFAISTTNTGEAWFGRGSDRTLGTYTLQLGGTSAANTAFEIVDRAWSKVIASISGEAPAGSLAVSSAGNVSTVGSMTSPNFRDALLDTNVNLGNAGTEGRGVVAGYSGGNYSGIGYNVRHTTSSGVYVAPATDTSSYLRFDAGGFNFYGAAGGAAGRTLSYSTLFSISSSGGLGASTLSLSSTADVALAVGNGSTGYAKIGATTLYDDGTYFSPKGGRHLYIRRADTPTTYIYSSNIYLGDGSSGTNVYFRDAALSGTSWSLTAAGAITAKTLALSNGDSSIATFGPNASWGAYLKVGAGPGQQAVGVASVVATDGNLHLDAATSKNIYIGYYTARDTYINAQGGNVSIGKASASGLLDLESTGTTVGYWLDGQAALTGYTGDQWLRLNANSSFTNGVYTPGALRSDGGIVSGGATTLGAGTILATGEIRGASVRSTTNIYTDSNYGYGLVGLYASTRYQAVFAMGDAYKLPADGSTTGSLYGLAWSHPNAGGVAANLNTHGLLVMENGTFLAAISGSIRARDDMRAPTFYDSNNTGYYLDPAGDSNLSGLIVGGGSSSNWATLDIGGTNSINAAGNIYSYGGICAGNASGDCSSVGSGSVLRSNGDVYANNYYTGFGTTYGLFGSRGRLDTLNSGSAGDALEFGYDVAGDFQLYGGDLSGVNNHYIYPARTDTTAVQKSWYLASNGSYGLYTNTGFYISGGVSMSGGNMTPQTGSYGSLDIGGSENGYSGIHFSTVTGKGQVLMVHNTSDVQGFYQEGVGWSWYFENGELQVGTVPWARVTGAPSFITDGNTGWDNAYGFVANGDNVSFTSIYTTDITVGGCIYYDNCMIKVDIAESFPISEDVEAGDVLVLDTSSSTPAVLKRASGSASGVVGIVSTAPAITIEGDRVSINGSTSTPSSYVSGSKAPVALAGRVPVKFSLENGVVHAGDYLTVSSTTPGKAAKAIKSGMIIGQALEDAGAGEEKVLVFVSHFYYEPSGVDLAALSERVDALDLRLAALESRVASSTASSSDGLTFDATTTQSILDIVKANIVDGVTHFIELAVDSFSTYALTVRDSATIGTAERPAGITVYDEDTREPYCMKIKSGAQISTPGACGSEVAPASTGQSVYENTSSSGGATTTDETAASGQPSSTSSSETDTATSTPAVSSDSGTASTTPETSGATEQTSADTTAQPAPDSTATSTDSGTIATP